MQRLRGSAPWCSRGSRLSCVAAGSPDARTPCGSLPLRLIISALWPFTCGTSAWQWLLVRLALLARTRALGIECKQRQRRLQLIEKLGIAFAQLRQLVLPWLLTLRHAAHTPHPVAAEKKKRSAARLARNQEVVCEVLSGKRPVGL